MNEGTEELVTYYRSGTLSIRFTLVSDNESDVWISTPSASATFHFESSSDAREFYQAAKKIRSNEEVQ